MVFFQFENLARILVPYREPVLSLINGIAVLSCDCARFDYSDCLVLVALVLYLIPVNFSFIEFLHQDCSNGSVPEFMQQNKRGLVMSGIVRSVSKICWSFSCYVASDALHNHV